MDAIGGRKPVLARIGTSLASLGRQRNTSVAMPSMAWYLRLEGGLSWLNEEKSSWLRGGYGRGAAFQAAIVGPINGGL